MFGYVLTPEPVSTLEMILRASLAVLAIMIYLGCVVGPGFAYKRMGNKR